MNIADRKRAEDALRDSEARLRFLTDQMADILWTADLNLRTTYVSPSIEKVLGFTPEERLQHSLDQAIRASSFGPLVEAFEQELRLETEGGQDPDRTRTLEIEYLKKDGSTIWLENKMPWIRDDQGAPTGILGVSRDVTERRRAEQALRRSETALAEAQTTAKLGSWSYDVDRDEPTWSKEMFRIFGRDAAASEPLRSPGSCLRSAASRSPSPGCSISTRSSPISTSCCGGSSARTSSSSCGWPTTSGWCWPIPTSSSRR